MGSMPNLPPDGGRSFFDGVETDLSGDVVLGNLEGTLSTAASSKCGAGSTNCYAFHTPPSYGAWLRKAGFTMLNLANNHAFDYGPSGRPRRSQRSPSRVSPTPAAPARSRYQQVGEIKVAVVGFAPYPWAQRLTNIPAARRLVQEGGRERRRRHRHHARRSRGHRPHARTAAGQRCSWARIAATSSRFAHAVVDAGADVVIGHGPHVLRGMEWYRGHLIAYSLGQLRRLQGVRARWAAVGERHPQSHAPRRRRIRQRHTRADPTRRQRRTSDRSDRARARDRPHPVAGGLRRPCRQGVAERRPDPLATTSTGAWILPGARSGLASRTPAP